MIELGAFRQRLAVVRINDHRRCVARPRAGDEKTILPPGQHRGAAPRPPPITDGGSYPAH